LRTEIRRLWQALHRVESCLMRIDYDLEGQATGKTCRLCGSQTNPDPDADIRHRQTCPFAALAFPAGQWSPEQEE